MSKKIYKYETELKNQFSIKMPKNAEILCVQVDKKTNEACIWALIDSDKESEYRDFELIGTGHEIYEDIGIDRKYIGTYQLNNGGFVGHLFERIN